MLRATRDHDTRWRQRYKTNGITDLVAPQTGIGVQDEGVVNAHFNLGQIQSAQRSRFATGPRPGVDRDELRSDPHVHDQQQALFIVAVLVGDETLACREQLDTVDLAADERPHPVAVGRVS